MDIEALKRRIVKLTARLDYVVTNTENLIELDENAYIDIKDGDYRSDYEYSYFQADENDVEIPEDLVVALFDCGAVFNKELPEMFGCSYFNCGELFDKELPKGFTCLAFHAGKVWDHKFPDGFSCDFLDISENTKFNHFLKGTWNIHQIRLNEEYYTQPLPEGFVEYTEGEDYEESSKFKVYINEEYVEQEPETEESEDEFTQQLMADDDDDEIVY